MQSITKVDILSGNYKTGRPSGYPIDIIVIHVMEGDMEGTRQWFNDPKSVVSAHYGISKTGQVVQYVEEKDTAFHAGRVDHPTASIVVERTGVNPNYYSIGVEHEGSGTEPLTDAQKSASVGLIKDICNRYSIPIDRQHIIGHREIYSLKTCPGSIDVDELVKLCLPTIPEIVNTKPQIVWSDWFKDWLIVTQVIDDGNWSFVPLKQIQKSQTKATTPLSQMPNAPAR